MGQPGVQVDLLAWVLRREHVVSCLRRGGDWVCEDIPFDGGVLCVDRHDSIDRVVHRDVHPRTCPPPQKWR